MSFTDEVLKLLNKIYREDAFTKALLKPLDRQTNDIYNLIEAIENNFFFDKLDENGCKWYEKLLKIVPKHNQTLEERRSSIQTKWLSNTHNDIDLIQTVCDAWKYGEVSADFVNGKIQIVFVGEYGIPDDLDGLLRAVDVVKPAHLAYFMVFKYLLIKDIHEVKTLEQMETLTINQFAAGRE